VVGGEFKRSVGGGGGGWWFKYAGGVMLITHLRLAELHPKYLPGIDRKNCNFFHKVQFSKDKKQQLVLLLRTVALSSLCPIPHFLSYTWSVCRTLRKLGDKEK